MKTFEEIYKIADESGSESAFNRAELEKLYELCVSLPKSPNVVEIGVQFGRSTSVIAEIQKARRERGELFQFVAIDNYFEDVSLAARRHVMNQKKKYDWKLILVVDDSHAIAEQYPNSIDLIHIDGGHEYEEVLQDCKDWLPKLVSDGYACFDDYGHDSLPGVYKAVSEYMDKSKAFKFIGRYGEKLGVFQKI